MAIAKRWQFHNTIKYLHVCSFTSPMKRNSFIFNMYQYHNPQFCFANNKLDVLLLYLCLINHDNFKYDIEKFMKYVIDSTWFSIKLQDPIPQAAEFDIKSYNPKRVVQSTMIRCQRKALNTPTLPLGCSLYKRATRSSRNKENKENSQTTVCEKGQECHQSNAMKRKKKLPAGLIPSSKKSKKVPECILVYVVHMFRW